MLALFKKSGDSVLAMAKKRIDPEIREEYFKQKKWAERKIYYAKTAYLYP